MVRNEAKYMQAVEFRKRGFTYSEIAKICGVSKATVSNWLSKQRFSEKVRETNAKSAAKENAKRLSLFNKAIKSERTARYREAVRSGETEYRHYKKDPLFTAGIAVYLSLGDRKSNGQIRLTSANMESQRIFIKFVKAYLGVSSEQLRVWLLLSPTHDEANCLKKWTRTTGLSIGRFGRSQVIDNKSSKKSLHFGTLNTIIGSTVLKQKLMRWLELLQKDF